MPRMPAKANVVHLDHFRMQHLRRAMAQQQQQRVPRRRDARRGSILDGVGKVNGESSGGPGASILDQNSYGFISW